VIDEAQPRHRFAALAARCCLLPALLAAALGLWAATALRERLSVEVPDVAGARIDEAIRMLHRAGLAPAPLHSERPLHPELRVAGTQPAAGVRAGRHSRVEIRLGEDPASLRVPDLVGLRRDEALELLSGTRFSLGLERALYTDAPPGIVGQRPRPDELARGGLIDVLISLGPEPPVFVAPELIGSGQEAVLRLWGTALGRVAEVRYRDAPAAQRGRVLLQQPPAGKPLGAEGLRLVVGAGPETPRFAVATVEAPPGGGHTELLLLIEDAVIARGRARAGEPLRVPLPLGDAAEALVIVLADGEPVAELRLGALEESSESR
jgi:beta-lactam-binding protein with PASTA domain